MFKAQKLCFVENLENFMLNTRLVNDGYTLLFPVGRLGTSLFERVKAQHIMHFGDLGKTITKKQAASDTLLRLCKEDESVKRVYDFIQQHNLFLEQEGYDD